MGAQEADFRKVLKQKHKSVRTIAIESSTQAPSRFRGRCGRLAELVVEVDEQKFGKPTEQPGVLSMLITKTLEEFRKGGLEI
jgi:hypothetical protein